MLRRLAKFWHHLTEPHCDACRAEIEEMRACASCETLRQQLEIANYEKRELLNKLIRPEPVVNEPNFNELRPKTVPWRVKREELEAEDRKRAAILKEKEKELNQVKSDVDELEKEVMK
jgi:hypothetical protein